MNFYKPFTEEDQLIKELNEQLAVEKGKVDKLTVELEEQKVTISEGTRIIGELQQQLANEEVKVQQYQKVL